MSAVEATIRRFNCNTIYFLSDEAVMAVQQCWLAAILALLLCGGATSFGEPTTVLVETESFEDLGGWVVDQQFMDLMGSPYVLAHGLGVPVADCSTTVQLPAAAKYRIWVRTRDWVAPWSAPGAPGRFHLVINDQTIGEFGTEGANWHWQDGGVHQLPKQLEVRLSDLTGFEGRCDAVLFSKDVSWRPPNDKAALAELRAQQHGWREPGPGKSFDLVVVGGGVAGTSAAITAARLGLSVALIQDRPVLGGNGSSEVRVWPEGGTNLQPYPRVGDVVSELIRSKGKGDGNAKAARVYDDQRKLDLARAEPNLTLLLEQRVNAANRSDSRIQSVIAQHIRSGERTRVRGRWFLDSTGDGVLGALVGADYEEAPKDNMGFSNLWNVGETEQNESQIACLCEDHEELDLSFTLAESPQPFPRCPWAIDLSERPFPGRQRYAERWRQSKTPLDDVGGWFWESGFGKDPIQDAEWIRDLNLRAMYGAWDALKNVDKLHSNHRLKWAAFVAGKRESRRLLGDLILDGSDFRDSIEYPDAAFPCTWAIDLHLPHKDYADAGDENAFISWATVAGGDEYRYAGPYWAPYRCLYSRNIDNLFMAGRDISVTHEALGAVRVMRTCGMMGEVVGMAASICKENRCDPRAVYTTHLAELKSLLEVGAGKNSAAVGERSESQARYNFPKMIQPADPTAEFREEDYYVWGGSMIVGDDGKYHLYYSRWPRQLGHNAWVTHSEVAHAVSDHPFGKMQHQDTALPTRGRDFWDGQCTHNPNVHRFGDKYYLYYMGNTGDRRSTEKLDWQHRNNQRIGVAVADSPTGPWRRTDQPLIAPSSGYHDALCCSNPSVTQSPDGSYLMIYKAVGDKRPLPFGGPVYHVVATSDSPTGPFHKMPDPVFVKQGVNFVAEDPFIWCDQGRFYAIVKDNNGHFTNAGRSTALFESADGKDWNLASKPLVAKTEFLRQDGSTQHLHALERPQIFFNANKPAALLFAADTDARRTHSFHIRIPLHAPRDVR
ncbi:MAG: FAD-dependent oxidoreductase [Planctomycetota bacterium]